MYGLYPLKLKWSVFECILHILGISSTTARFEQLCDKISDVRVTQKVTFMNLCQAVVTSDQHTIHSGLQSTL